MFVNDGPAPLRLGLPEDMTGGTLSAAIEASGPGVLTHAPAGVLTEGLLDGALDAALLFPLDAVRIPGCRCVPGVGLTAPSTAAAGPFLSSRCSLDAAGEIRVEYPDALGVEAARLLAAPGPGILPPVRVVSPDALEAPEGAALTRAPLGEHSQPLGALWFGRYQQPLVLGVWACRFRAPYAALRQRLWPIHQHLAETGQARGELDGYGFQVLSGESSGIRHLVSLARSHGLAGPDQDFEYC